MTLEFRNLNVNNPKILPLEIQAVNTNNLLGLYRRTSRYVGCGFELLYLGTADTRGGGRLTYR